MNYTEYSHFYIHMGLLHHHIKLLVIEGGDRNILPTIR